MQTAPRAVICAARTNSVIKAVIVPKDKAMQKSAPTDSPIHELIRERWSPRAFADKTIAPDILRSLFEAARWAPSSNNEQPWAYLVATKDNKENFAKTLSVLVDFNANWAKSAPLLAIAVAKLAFAKNNTPNRNASYDLGAATALLSMEATARGLAVHQMAGFDPEKARQVFGILSGWEAFAALAIGYPGDPASLPQPLKDREMAPRTRKPIAEFVMSGHWEHTAPFLSE
jgi:nitroreductase